MAWPLVEVRVLPYPQRMTMQLMKCRSETIWMVAVGGRDAKAKRKLCRTSSEIIMRERKTENLLYHWPLNNMGIRHQSPAQLKFTITSDSSKILPTNRLLLTRSLIDNRNGQLTHILYDTCIIFLKSRKAREKKILSRKS